METIDLEDRNWRAQAACRPGSGANPDIFVYASNLEDTFSGEHKKNMEQAAKYCGECTVKDECLDYGLAINKGVYAMYGGRLIDQKGRIAQRTIRPAA